MFLYLGSLITRYWKSRELVPLQFCKLCGDMKPLKRQFFGLSYQSDVTGTDHVGEGDVPLVNITLSPCRLVSWLVYSQACIFL